MSSSSTVQIPISLPNVDVFTFGKSSLYGYDSMNHCLVVYSLLQINNLNDIPIHYLHLSSSPTWPIRRLVLNDDESTIALLAEKIVYLVDLSKSSVHTIRDLRSKGWSQCSIIRVPPLASSSTTIVCSLIDFVWLNPNYFAVVYTMPSASECHIYAIRSSRPDALKLIQTFSVGSLPKNRIETPNRKISLHQSSDIIKLDVAKRKYEDSEYILLFAIKTDGDMFVLDIEHNQLLSNENRISAEFQGPIRILPSTFDNFGCNHGQSTFICLSNVNNPIIVFTRDKSRLNQCIVLSTSSNSYNMFTIDSICLPGKDHNQMIASIIRDPFSSNQYYVSDSASNVYLCELSWVDKIKKGLKQLPPTRIKHVINGTNENSKAAPKIRQMGLIQTNNHGQYLGTVVKSQVDLEKELVLILTKSSELDNKTQALSETSSAFVEHICSLLARDRSLPFVTLSTTPVNISDADFGRNLSKFIDILNEQYLNKQDNVRKEIENKRKYLSNLQQTQFNECKDFDEKFQRIRKWYSILSEQYRQECARRKHLALNTNDNLSIIEQATPVLSQAEKLMLKQLEDYDIQIKMIVQKMKGIQDSMRFNQNQKVFDTSSIENVQEFIKIYRSQIEQMQKKVHNIQNNN